MADEPERQSRGVQNPQVVDLISWDDEREEVVLLMLEEREWGADAEQLRQLEDKFNAYLSYVMGGHLVEQYPQYAGRDVCFRFDCAEAPQGEARDMLRAMQNFAEAENIRLVVQVIQGTAG